MYVLLLVVLLVMVVYLIEQDPGAHSVRAASCCVVGDGCVSDRTRPRSAQCTCLLCCW
jgi:hypothetical protein